MFKKYSLSLLILVLSATQTLAWKRKKIWFHSGRACAGQKSEIYNPYDYGECMSEPGRQSLYVIRNNDKDQHCLLMSDDTCNGETWVMEFHRKANLCWDLPDHPNGKRWMSFLFIEGACDDRGDHFLASPCQHPHKDEIVTVQQCQREVEQKSDLRKMTSESVASSVASAAMQVTMSTVLQQSNNLLPTTYAPAPVQQPPYQQPPYQQPPYQQPPLQQAGVVQPPAQGYPVYVTVAAPPAAAGNTIATTQSVAERRSIASHRRGPSRL